MPGYDRTGPLGKGSMSGRGLGLCKGNRKKISLKERSGFGRGRGLGRGFRRGFGRRYIDAEPVDLTNAEIKMVLKKDLEELKAEERELEEEINNLK